MLKECNACNLTFCYRLLPKNLNHSEPLLAYGGEKYFNLALKKYTAPSHIKRFDVP